MTKTAIEICPLTSSTGAEILDDGLSKKLSRMF